MPSLSYINLTKKSRSYERTTKEIVLKFRINLRPDNRSWEYEYKKCALICVDEIINSGFGTRLIEFNYPNKNSTKLLPPLKYWQEVKKEIESLKQ